MVCFANFGTTVHKKCQNMLSESDPSKNTPVLWSYTCWMDMPPDIPAGELSQEFAFADHLLSSLGRGVPWFKIQKNKVYKNK